MKNSICCGAPMPDWPDYDFCPCCKEHSEPVPTCSECGKDMFDDETNYGTEDILVCIHCYELQQEGIKEWSEQVKNEE